MRIKDVDGDGNPDVLPPAKESQPLKSVAEIAGDSVPPEQTGAESIVGDANFPQAPAGTRPAPVEQPQPDEIIYSCHPLERFNIGSKWRFERGQLKVSPEEAEELDKYLKNPKTDSFTKRTVRKIDLQAAEAFLTKHVANARRGTVESSDALNQAGQQVGTKPVIDPGG